MDDNGVYTGTTVVQEKCLVEASTTKEHESIKRAANLCCECASLAVFPCPAIPRGSRGCVRGSRLSILWPGTRLTRRICRVGGRRPRGLAASVDGERLPVNLPVSMLPGMMTRVLPANALACPCASSCEIRHAPPRKSRCRVEWERASYEPA